MNKELIFLLISLGILLLSVISTFTAPIINNINSDFSRWGKINCQFYADKEKDSSSLDEIQRMKKLKNLCNRQKAMHNLEYASLIINIVLSFVSSQLGLLLYFKTNDSINKISGIFGLITSIICFVLTLVYICYSGYIFNNDTAYKVVNPNISNYYNTNNCIQKLFKNGAIYQWRDATNYLTAYNNDKSDDAQYIKYKDLGKKQYNYNKEYNEMYSKIGGCFIATTRPTRTGGGDCEYSYAAPKMDSKNEYLFDNWIVTIIFCCFIIAGQIGLGIFGFMIFKGKSEEKGELIPFEDKDKEIQRNENRKPSRLKNENLILNLKK